MNKKIWFLALFALTLTLSGCFSKKVVTENAQINISFSASSPETTELYTGELDLVLDEEHQDLLALFSGAKKGDILEASLKDPFRVYDHSLVYKLPALVITEMGKSALVGETIPFRDKVGLITEVLIEDEIEKVLIDQNHPVLQKENTYSFTINSIK